MDKELIKQTYKLGYQAGLCSTGARLKKQASDKEEKPISELKDGVYSGRRYGYTFELSTGEKYKTSTGTRCTREHCGGVQMYRVSNGSVIPPISMKHLKDGKYKAIRYLDIYELEDGRLFRDPNNVYVKQSRNIALRGGYKPITVQGGRTKDWHLNKELIKKAFQLGYRHGLEKVGRSHHSFVPYGNFAGRRGVDYDRLEPDENVKHFYDVIVPYIKSHSSTAGVPGKDYDASKFVPGFYNNIPVAYGSRSDPWFQPGKRFTGYSHPEKGVVVRPGRGFNPSLAVHEFKHQQNNDGRSGLGGRSAADNALLSNAYGFSRDSMRMSFPDDSDRLLDGRALQEQGTTNAEHQFDIMREYRENNGRNPTGPEFVDFIRGADDKTLDRWRGYSPNRYQTNADRINGTSYKTRDEIHDYAVQKAEQLAQGIDFPDDEWIWKGEDFNRYSDQDWFKAHPDLPQNYAEFDDLGIGIPLQDAFIDSMSNKFFNEQLRRKATQREAFRDALMNVSKNTQPPGAAGVMSA